MNKTNWKIHVGTQPGRIGVDVSIYHHTPDGKLWIMNTDESGNTIVNSYVEDGSVRDIKPTFHVPAHEFDDILKAFIEYGKSRGFKDANESFSEGKLLATEKHLEDMRDLVFGYDVKRDHKKIINVQQDCGIYVRDEVKG